MTKLRMAAVFILALLFGWGISVCSSQNNTPDIRETVALETLEQLKRFPPEVLNKLGFSSPQTVQGGRLGNPLNAFIVTMGSLKHFQSGDDPHRLLEDVEETGYPVYSGRLPVSSITLRKRDGKWTGAVIGGKEVRFAEESRQKQNQSGPAAQREYFMVQVQPLYMSFLAFDADTNLYLIPTHPHPDLFFPLHVPVLAEVVFRELRNHVNEYEGESDVPPPGSPDSSATESENAAAGESASTLSGKEKTGTFGNVKIRLTVAKSYLEPRETTTFTVTFEGLEPGNGDVRFRLRNKTPGIVRMTAGDLQHHTIPEEDIRPGGIYSITQGLTGIVPGKFDVGIKLFPAQKKKE